MAVDTGSAVSIVSELGHKRWFKHHKLQPTQFHLKTYSGDSLPLLGGNSSCCEVSDPGNATTSGGRSKKKARVAWA